MDSPLTELSGIAGVCRRLDTMLPPKARYCCRLPPKRCRLPPIAESAGKVRLISNGYDHLVVLIFVARCPPVIRISLRFAVFRSGSRSLSSQAKASEKRLSTLAGRPLRGNDASPSGASMPSIVGSEGSLVHVRSYVRTVDGKSVTVSAHTRSDPPGGKREDAGSSIAIAYRRSAACDAQLVRDSWSAMA